MKIVLNVVGVLLILVGIVWFLQGLNVLLGSFMSGQPLYAILGAVLGIIGTGLLVFNNRRARVNR
jgi:mannose/fructose/N-acetylgalactosamine-specific phosphotransferase system component IIC